MSAPGYPMPASPSYPAQAPAHDPTAVMGARIVAGIIDVLLYLLLIGFLSATPLSPLAEYDDNPQGLSMSDACEILQDRQDAVQCYLIGDKVYWTDGDDLPIQIGAWLAFVGGYILLQGVTGFSPGKLLLGLRVVREDGQVAGAGKSFLRTLLWIVDGLPCFFLVGFISALTSDGHRRVGDMAAKTFVIRKAEVGRPVVVPGMGLVAAPGMPGGGYGTPTVYPSAPPYQPTAPGAPGSWGAPPSPPGAGVPSGPGFPGGPDGPAPGLPGAPGAPFGPTTGQQPAVPGGPVGPTTGQQPAVPGAPVGPTTGQQPAVWGAPPPPMPPAPARPAPPAPAPGPADTARFDVPFGAGAPPTGGVPTDSPADVTLVSGGPQGAEDPTEVGGPPPGSDDPTGSGSPVGSVIEAGRPPADPAARSGEQPAAVDPATTPEPATATPATAEPSPGETPEAPSRWLAEPSPAPSTGDVPSDDAPSGATPVPTDGETTEGATVEDTGGDDTEPDDTAGDGPTAAPAEPPEDAAPAGGAEPGEDPHVTGATEVITVGDVPTPGEDVAAGAATATAAGEPPATADDATEPGPGGDATTHVTTPTAEAGSGEQAAQQSDSPYKPQWDAARGAYIQWDPNRSRWLQWDDTAKEWNPI